MARTSRRHAVGTSPGAIADDLRLARERGGLFEAGRKELEATLFVLGLDHPSEDEVAHARRVLIALLRQVLSSIEDNYPERDDDPPEGLRPGQRRRQPWQLLGARALWQMLLVDGGTRGMVDRARFDIAISYELHERTVKRYEDDLIDRLLAPQIHDRLIAEHALRDRVVVPMAPRSPPPADPLWEELGATEAELADALLANARIHGRGFDGQEYGRGEPSRASSGMVTYALAMTPAIPDEVIAELYEEIVSWITPGGVLPRRHGSTVESTWTESQCLLALTARPHLLNGHPGPIRLADGLARQQQSGGWFYSGAGTGRPHPVWSFYPLMALKRSAKLEWISGPRYRRAAQRSARHAVASIGDDLRFGDQLVALSLGMTANEGTVAQESVEVLDEVAASLSGELAALNARNLRPWTIIHDRQPLWHARMNPALLYLHARRALGPAHPFTAALIRRLLSEFDPVNMGWTNGQARTSRPYTWTTAIALRSCQILRRDIEAGRLPWPLDGDESLGLAGAG